MEVIFLKNDGRCKWLEKKVLLQLLPQMASAAQDSNKKTMYLIEDWISNDGGKVGADIGWLNSLRIPMIKTINNLPEGRDFTIVNTGYDSIVDEERLILAKGIDYIDQPCPYVRNVRKIFENVDNSCQYILLCDENHIIIKNYKSLFPSDMILVQKDNYKEKILEKQNGKPLILVPYVTFLPSHINNIYDFVSEKFPNREITVKNTSCMWVSSLNSPIVEINNMNLKELEGVKDALLITSPGTTNKSVVSLIETLENKSLSVITISSLEDFIEYEKNNMISKVLLVRSPIPNNIEKPIVSYIRNTKIQISSQIL